MMLPVWLADWFVQKEPLCAGNKRVRQTRLLLAASANQLLRTVVAIVHFSWN